MKTLSDKETVQSTVKASRLYGDYMIMLIAPCVLALWHYGARALGVIAVSMAGAVFTDLICCALFGKAFRLKDLSNLFIGTVIALMMPAGIPLHIPLFASAFAVAAVKQPFGGALRSPFVPAAAGFAFASVCFKEFIFDYSYNSADKLIGEYSLGALLTQGNAVYLDAVNALDIFSGNVAGPMGTGCGLLMAASCVFLLVRRKGALFTTAGFVVACAVFAAIFPRVNASALTSVVLELSAGSLLFAAVFLLTDYAATPRSVIARVISGAVCGVFCMLMRAVGTYEETVCFAVLLANGFTPLFNMAADWIDRRLKRKGSAA